MPAGAAAPAFSAPGVHPGFMGEILALTLGGLCTQIDTLTIPEFVNLSHQKNPQGLRMFGFDGDPVETGEQGQSALPYAGSVLGRYPRLSCPRHVR